MTLKKSTTCHRTHLINDLEEVYDWCCPLAHGAEHRAEGETEEDDAQGVGSLPETNRQIGLLQGQQRKSPGTLLFCRIRADFPFKMCHDILSCICRVVVTYLS